jgi:nucleotide-binding universal stress UspA family protein
MTAVHHVLCPVDFSEASRAALRCAVAVAEHFTARLTVLTVDDPLLAQVAAHSSPSLTDETERELRRFCGSAIERPSSGGVELAYSVVIGKPAAEILREAGEGRADLIVMSSQGRSGARKMFFGSTTERVLRETTRPVLVTPDTALLARALADPRQLTRIIVPVDLTDASMEPVRIAAAIGSARSVPVVLVYVLEPVFVPYSVRMAIGGVDAARRERAEEQIADIARRLAPGVPVETVILTGDPSEEITKLVDTRHANLIVMGLHSAGALGPRMGSVTYRVLCLSHAPVLALPPTRQA